MARKTTIIITLLIALSGCFLSNKCEGGTRKKIKRIEKYYEENKVQLNELFQLAEGAAPKNMMISIFKAGDSTIGMGLLIFDAGKGDYGMSCSFYKSNYAIKESPSINDCSVASQNALNHFITSDTLHKILAILEKIHPREVRFWRGTIVVSPETTIPFKTTHFKPVLYYKRNDDQVSLEGMGIEQLDAHIYLRMICGY